MKNNENIQEIIKKVNDVFNDVLENDELTVTYETTASDVDEWDSLSHILLVVAIEKYFQIEFTAKEMQNFKNVGEMCEGIILKTKK